MMLDGCILGSRSMKLPAGLSHSFLELALRFLQSLLSPPLCSQLLPLLADPAFLAWG